MCLLNDALRESGISAWGMVHHQVDGIFAADVMQMVCQISKKSRLVLAHCFCLAGGAVGSLSDL